MAEKRDKSKARATGRPPKDDDANTRDTVEHHPDGEWYASTRMLDKRLSARLKALRKEHGLAVKRVAVLLDVSEQHVHGIEGGYGSQPSLNALEDLARIYKVDECDLFVFPGEGVRHDIREELRRVPSIDGEKLAAILKVMREMVRLDTATIESLLTHLDGGSTRKKRRKPSPR